MEENVKNQFVLDTVPIYLIRADMKEKTRRKVKRRKVNEKMNNLPDATFQLVENELYFSIVKHRQS